MKRIVCFIFFMLCYSNSFAKGTQLFVNGSAEAIHQSTSAVRLETALEILSPAPSTYWLGATFGKPYDSSFVLLHSKVMAVLEQLCISGAACDQSQRQAVQRLINQLSQLRFAHKTFLPVEPDRVRLGRSPNPLLQGDYAFYFPSRPHQVKLIGLVSPSVLLFEEGASFRDYLSGLSLYDWADRAHQYVIQPDGTVIRANIGYWLKDNCNIAPGATLFIGFNDLPDGFESLNRNIVELLRYQLPWWE